MKKLLSIALALLCVCSLAGCRKKAQSPPVPLDEIEKINETDPNAAAWTMIEAMTLDEKIYQLFVAAPGALSGEDAAKEVNDAMREGLARYPVGGVAISMENVEGRRQVETLLSSLQEASSIPLFTAVYAEDGGASLADVSDMGITEIPERNTIADSMQANGFAKTLGEELKELGINLEFAPIADTAPAEGDARFYAADPDRVGVMAAETVRGLRDGGVASCIAHFPGQGDATFDEDSGKIRSARTYEEMQEKELLPFKDGILAGADFVMVSNMINQSITKTDMECTMSTNVMTNILRRTMGFPNIILTDSFSGKGITGYYSAGAAALTALEAGADMILMPENLEEAHAAIRGAVQSGRVSEMRINESVSRILKVKLQRGIL